MALKVEYESHQERKQERQNLRHKEPKLVLISNASSTQISVTTDVSQEQTKDATLIIITYDVQDKLTQLKIGGRNEKPRKIFQILGRIISFHPRLTSFTVQSPIDNNIVYEISKYFQVSNITELTLDGCVITEAKFYLLLEDNKTLSKLSLARCGVTDDILEDIMSKLIYPAPASKVLCILNLPSNQITDEGANHIATMLRSNTKLYYLNLADNDITDFGAKSIFNALTEFEISYFEMYNYKVRYMEYIKQKLEVMNNLNEQKCVENLIQTKLKIEVRKSSSRSQSIRCKSDNATTEDVVNKESILSGKVVKGIGELSDPLHNWYSKDAKIYSSGNHYLQCLNLGYNKISSRTLDLVVHVLGHQKELNRNPRGLITLCLDGNLLPKYCEEYEQIEDFLSDAVLWQGVSKDIKQKPAGSKKVKSKNN